MQQIKIERNPFWKKSKCRTNNVKKVATMIASVCTEFVCTHSAWTNVDIHFWGWDINIILWGQLANEPIKKQVLYQIFVETNCASSVHAHIGEQDSPLQHARLSYLITEWQHDNNAGKYVEIVPRIFNYSKITESSAIFVQKCWSLLQIFLLEFY